MLAINKASRRNFKGCDKIYFMNTAQKDSKTNNLYLPITSEITGIENLSADEKLFRIHMLDSYELKHKPGQFVQLSLFGYGEAPISIASSPTRGPIFELIVRKAGKLTKELHEYKVGNKIGIRGPFGNAFDTNIIKNKDIIIVAGGIGIAPLRSLIQYIVDHRSDYKTTTILYGSRSPEAVILKKEFIEWQQASINLQLIVDTTNNTPWEHNTGLITNLIKPLTIDNSNTYVFVVGPPVMYKPIISELEGKKISHENIYVSLERYMKCGVGKCGHCTIGDNYCCIEGPVFTYNDLKHINEAI